MSTRKKKSVPSDIRSLHCLGRHCLPTRMGQFPCPQVEHLPPCSTKSRRNLPLPLTTSAPLQGGRPSLRFPGNNRFTPIEATRRPGAAPRKQPLNTRLRCPRPKAPADPARLFGACPSIDQNRLRNSPARHWPPPHLQGRNPGAGSTACDRRRLGANLRLPLGTREILCLSPNRATRNFTKKLSLFLVDFGCKTLSAIATSLMVHTVTIYPHLVHMPLKSPPKPILAVFSRGICSRQHYTDMVVLNSDFFFLDP